MCQSNPDCCDSHPAAAQAETGNTPSISAEELHGIIVKAHLVGNNARRKLIRAMLAMHEARLFLKLGCSSIFQYAEKHFGYLRTQTYEFLRVARALKALPGCDAAFREGKLNWTVLAELTRVAAPDTEAEWLEFAAKNTPVRLLAEIKDCIRKRRKTPRKDRHGLPNITVRLAFDLSSEEHDLIEKALGKAARDLAESLGGERVGPKDALLFIARWMLERAAADGEGNGARDDSLYTILYHRCPDCHSAHLPTADGLVEIPGEVVDQVEGDAVRVTIDPDEERAPVESAPVNGVPVNGVPVEERAPLGKRPEGAAQVEAPRPVPPEERDRPNPAALVRRVLLRDGMVCANPMCRRKGPLHAHHIIYRENGGRTALWNEVCVCDRCHACIHAGLLRIVGDPVRGIVWRTRGDGIVVDVSAELAALAGAPEVRVTSGRPDEAGNSRLSGLPDASGNPDGSGSARERPEWLLKQPLMAMEKLGYSKEQGMERLLRAWEQLSAGGKVPSDHEVVCLAVSG